MGERFTGLPSNNPLGHYFDALHITGYYYTFIGVVQLFTALCLLIPRTSLLGALMYFPIIVNICVLTYATRFDGTRIVTMMMLASLFLLIWDSDRIRHIFTPPTKRITSFNKRVNVPLRIVFFPGVIAVIAIIIAGTFYLYDIVPGNSEEECRNQCAVDKNPEACQAFCNCIYQQGRPLDSCLAEYHKAKAITRVGGR